MTAQELTIISTSQGEMFSVWLDESGDLMVRPPSGRSVWSTDETPNHNSGTSVELSIPSNARTASAGSTRLTKRDRTRMYKMFEKNIESSEIASKLGISAPSVAAYRANWTRSQ